MKNKNLTGYLVDVLDDLSGPITISNTLDGDGGSCKCIFKIVLIQQVKNLVQIPCHTVIAGQLLHRSTPLQKNGDRATINTVPLWVG